ncbi:class I SAM-dependent RNA methyltransferase [Sphingosinicella rhizophila]|uniref:Class I SAM-dependent RNA methyltransferase n=1 Tax=Sphingosinicella rhizophila TaxID=3050082 RepID=A0ABU3Q299_9SPHN|nr:class I SAM-dependent RNA methyltransferase [Sphingosinicella sp. GR2756]MDT9597532.1 class I SAM-dependent RNA methyltransferase [Sphingosinicella sp. GR2756]
MPVNDDDEVIRLAARGDGVTAKGRFAPLTAPGDRIASDGTIIAGPHRQVPPCRHFPLCGGCQLQHVDDGTYGAFLIDRIVSALSAQAVPLPTILPPNLSPPNSRRRASLRATRKGKAVFLGFNAEASHDIVDMRECHILRPELFALMTPLRTLLSKILPQRGAGGVRMTLVDQGVDVMLEGVSADSLEATTWLSDFAARHRLARLSIDDGYGAQPRWEPDPVTVAIDGVPVPFPEGAFLQATAEGEAALVAAVREAIGDARIVVDLFAGLGTFALSLPGRILAAEGARDAVLSLKSAANRAQRQIVVDHRDLFRRPFEADELSRFEAVVIDPPRAGAREQAAQLALSNVAKVASVSCNPATFARDAKILVEGGYRLEWVKPIGQFRWSTHVELVGFFARR